MGDIHPSPRTLGKQARIILSLLCGHEGVTTTHMFDVLWAADEDGGPETWDKIIQVHISNLRKFLAPRNIQILTADRRSACGPARYYIPMNQREAARAIAFNPALFHGTAAREEQRDQMNARA